MVIAGIVSWRSPCGAQVGLPVVTGFAPTTAVNTGTTVIQVDGVGFQPSDVVALNRCSPLALSTTYVSASTLLATAGPAFYAGFYYLEIRRSGAYVAGANGGFTFQNPPPTINSVSPALLSGGSTTQFITISGANLGGWTDPCNGGPESTYIFRSAAGMFYSVFAGPHSSTLKPVPPELTRVPGPGIVEIWNPPPGGGVASFPVNIACGSLGVLMHQPAGSGSLRIRVACGAPGVPYLTAISFEQENAINPGSGWWGGLHITLIDLANQVTFQAPPFVGTLDASGEAVFDLPAGSLSPGLPPAYAVTRTFGPGVFSILSTSPVVSLAPQ